MIKLKQFPAWLMLPVFVFVGWLVRRFVPKMTGGAQSPAKYETVETSGKSYLNATGEPIGIRNNNPLNIVKSSTAWKGKLPHDSKNKGGRFEQFQDWSWGVRAAIVNIRTWHGRGFDTIEKLINKWAPPIENDTNAYVNHVATATGIDKNQKFTFDRATILKIVQSMAKMETGKFCVTTQDFDTAWQRLSA